MAFDNLEPKNEQQAALDVAVVELTAMIAELREAMAPLLEKHQRERKQILELERQHQRYLLEQTMLAQAYADCDCTPNRTAALAGQFSNWLNNQIGSAAYKA